VDPWRFSKLLLELVKFLMRKAMATEVCPPDSNMSTKAMFVKIALLNWNGKCS